MDAPFGYSEIISLVKKPQAILQPVYLLRCQPRGLDNIGCRKIHVLQIAGNGKPFVGTSFGFAFCQSFSPSFLFRSRHDAVVVPVFLLTLEVPPTL